MKKDVDVQISIKWKDGKRVKLDLIKTLFGKKYFLLCNNKKFKRLVTKTEITNHIREII